MKTLFVLGAAALTTFAHALFPFDRTDAVQVQRLSAPSHIVVSSLIQNQHSLLGPDQYVEN